MQRESPSPRLSWNASLARLITIGNFDDDLKRLAEVDWIIEAVVENLDLKRALLKRVEAIRKPGTIITTNTSGLPVGKIAEGFSEDFRRSWFGTHFFNPPRYMRLLEIIPTPDSDRTAIDAVAHFCDIHLGKGIVMAKDTPNFIGNRIGTFSVLNVMRLMQEMDLSIEDVDALTGQAVGWPRSATFRTIDLVGLDILGHVVSNTVRVAGDSASPLDERSDLKLPDFYKQMLERKWLGDKTKGGFYKKVKSAKGEEERLALDWKTLEYHPRQKPKFPALDMAKNIEQPGARLKMLLGLDGSAPQKNDRAGAFLWSALSDLWTYCANRIPEISDSIVEIDRAMRLGFNWELGPFELWDAAGVEATVERMKKEERPIAANVEQLLASGKKAWYLDDPKATSGRAYWDLKTVNYNPVEAPSGVWSVEVAKKSNGVREEELRSIAGRSRRRRGLHRISFQDEHDWQRHRATHRANFEARRRRRRIRRIRHYQRRNQLFRWRESHVVADVDPGRRVGRRRPRDSHFPEHDPGDQVLSKTGSGCAFRLNPRRRHGDFPACRRLATSRRTLHGVSRSRSRLASRSRRLQRNAAARGRQRRVDPARRPWRIG